MENAKKGSYEYVQLQQKISEKMFAYSNSNIAVKSILLIKPNGELINSMDNGSRKEQFSQEDWFKKIVGNNSGTVWLDSREDVYSGGSMGAKTPTFALD
ncbi:cache domain-containing protein [Paenibacillus sp. N3.4]|uniref:cache domain-containing protein n=1 Tax=Paenibacillus sp. N3.4 TaxID=2603222 RepID=UPI00164FBA8F|nr:cache domain-containing protein [Paenibacillus sp. N3.4]